MPKSTRYVHHTTRVLAMASLVTLLFSCATEVGDAESVTQPIGRALGRSATPPSAEQIERFIAKGIGARAIFVGEIVSIDRRLSQPDQRGRVLPFRFVTWRVERAVRGIEPGGRWTGRFVGGDLPDGRTLTVSEMPEFELGQRALVLANDGDNGSCPLVGCRDGLLAIGVAQIGLPASVPSAAIRSADANLPITFTTPTRAGQGELDAARVAGRDRRARSLTIPSAGNPREVEALKRNGFDPVLR